MKEREPCPGVTFEDGSPSHDCEETPSRIAVLVLPDGQAIQTDLMFCEECAENGWHTNAAAANVYEWRPKLKRTVRLWCEAKGIKVPDEYQIAVRYRRPRSSDAVS